MALEEERGGAEEQSRAEQRSGKSMMASLGLTAGAREHACTQYWHWKLFATIEFTVTVDEEAMPRNLGFRTLMAGDGDHQIFYFHLPPQSQPLKPVLGQKLGIKARLCSDGVYELLSAFC